MKIPLAVTLSDIPITPFALRYQEINFIGAKISLNKINVYSVYLGNETFQFLAETLTGFLSKRRFIKAT